MHCNFSFFFFNDTATTEIYTLSLHDALPISLGDDLFTLDERHHALVGQRTSETFGLGDAVKVELLESDPVDRKSTRLNSSHANISYAVFCLKKKKTDDLRCSHPLIGPRQYI